MGVEENDSRDSRNAPRDVLSQSAQEEKQKCPADIYPLGRNYFLLHEIVFHHIDHSDPV